MRAGADV
ncbi:hypothetical protein F383_03736 [Gossypium arboreum]|nr:hypothetical protein F383_03736 [Gossypium arboreum]